MKIKERRVATEGVGFVGTVDVLTIPVPTKPTPSVATLRSLIFKWRSYIKGTDFVTFLTTNHAVLNDNLIKAVSGESVLVLFLF